MSKYLDDIYDIRVKPRRAERAVKPKVRLCEWPGCQEKADHKAPKSRDAIREYRWFCLAHVREYNKSWNFFEGLSEDAVRAMAEKGNVWDRPTWKTGTNPGADGRTSDFRPGEEGPQATHSGGFSDPFDLFDDGPGTQQASRDWTAGSTLPVKTRKALAELNLDEEASLNDIKARYKELLIRYHPDTNGGDRSKEERLKKVLDAFNHLRAAGYGAERDLDKDHRP